MSKLHVTHLQRAIENLFNDKIDMSDVEGKTDPELQNMFLTRGLAAYALYVLVPVDVEIASKTIVDGYDDNGIDAIFFDKNNKALWLIQSKWIKDGKGEPDNGEVKKFIGGIQDLIEFNLDRFNTKVKSKEIEITEALSDSTIKIKIVTAFTGQGFSTHNQRDVDDLMRELNEPSELASFHIFSLKEAHQALTGSIAGKPINVEVALSNWGQIEEPFKAFYGQISAADIAQWWGDNRVRLLSENIRSFIGLTDINEGIIETLAKEPQNFLYFNNGITVLCKKITKKPLGGSEKKYGIFDCDGISIVNGAQTVGCIGSVAERNSEILKEAKVFVRLISLENCPADFGVRVTKATNTQNKIEKRDFVTLDPEQERLQTELSLEGKSYHYIRTDEKIVPDDKNCALEEATISLACANDDVTLSVQAKREIGKLWEDTSKPPYTDIFNSSLTPTKLWRSIQVFRNVNAFLKSQEQMSIGRKKSFYIHGNRFVLHMVFQKIDKNALWNPNYDFDNFRNNDLPSLIQDITESCRVKMEEKYPTSLVHQLFRNFTKCKDIKSALI